MIREGRTLDHPPVAEGHPRAGEKKPLRPVFARPARLLWLLALECHPANPRAATLLAEELELDEGRSGAGPRSQSGHSFPRKTTL